MGRVKDIYWHHDMRAGDEFVGRCAAMLNLMNGEFASSPAFFKGTVDRDKVQSAINDVFPHFAGCEMGPILEHCLASMVCHADKILNLPPNHVARSTPLLQKT